MLFKFQFSDGPGKPTISVSFSDTEIGVARRHQNRCRFTGRLVPKLNENKCRQATPKSVSVYGTFGAPF